MEIKTREDIKNFVISLENNFPVNSWTANDIHLWPLIRLELFFHIRKVLYHEKKEPNYSVSHKKKNGKSLFLTIQTYFTLLRKTFFHIYFISGLKKRKYCFVSNNVSRLKYAGSYYNRFFDTIIDFNQIKDKSFIIEFGKLSTSELCHSDIIFSYSNLLDNFEAFRKVKDKLKKKENIKLELDGYDKLLEYLDNVKACEGFSKKFSQPKLMQLVKEKYFLRIELFTKIFEKLRPEKVIILCYYSDLAIVAAANKLKIETIDYQHGAQTSEHLAYGSWSKVPETGYDFLPRTFWNWNDSSKQVIESWSKQNTLYKSIAGGNVWVDYWMAKKGNEDYQYKNYLLYTLQPDSLRMNQLFPTEMIKVIKSKKHMWFIRLHPRQHKIKHEIEAYLNENGILDLVSIDKPTSDPLPIVLKNCLIHLTNSSASTIEASLFGKKTVLLDEVGRLYYNELIKESMAYYIPADTNFEERLNEVILNINNCLPNKLNKTMFYKEYFA